MSWSEDFVKLLQSLQAAIKTTKCQSSLSAPCRCSSRYPYAEALRWWHHTIINFNMAVQSSSIGSSTTMGEVWHHDAISIKRYWHLMSCTSTDFMFHQSLSSQLHLSMPVLFLSSLLIFLSKFLSEFELSYSYVCCHVSSYLAVLGCQVQPFWSFIILLCTSDIWLPGCHLVSSWCHI
jgi:hypothetical protein